MQRSRRIAAVLVVLGAALALVASAVTAATRPLITVNPATGIPGQTLTVRGSGFCGSANCSPVSIEIYGVIAAQNVRVSPAGTFTQRLRIPGGASGEVGLLAAQTLEDGSELQALATFDYVVRTRKTPPTKSAAPKQKPKANKTSRAHAKKHTHPKASDTPTPTTTLARQVPPGAKKTAADTGVTHAYAERRAAAPTPGDDGSAPPVEWAALGAAVLAGAIAAAYGVRVRRRQQTSTR